MLLLYHACLRFISAITTYFCSAQDLWKGCLHG